TPTPRDRNIALKSRSPDEAIRRYHSLGLARRRYSLLARSRLIYLSQGRFEIVEVQDQLLGRAAGTTVWGLEFHPNHRAANWNRADLGMRQNEIGRARCDLGFQANLGSRYRM